MNRLAIIATLTALSLSACQKRDQASTTDSTARDLTLAPTESTTAMRDVPANPPPSAPRTNPPAARPPAARPPAPPPAARPATHSLSAGAKFDVAANDTISS